MGANTKRKGLWSQPVSAVGHCRAANKLLHSLRRAPASQIPVVAASVQPGCRSNRSLPSWPPQRNNKSSNLPTGHCCHRHTAHSTCKPLESCECTRVPCTGNKSFHQVLAPPPHAAQLTSAGPCRRAWATANCGRSCRGEGCQRCRILMQHNRAPV
jgi:hypothetical protein